MNLLENILLLNKPKGISSFGFISNIKKKLGVKKIGHAGTLDPLASGLMIVGVNEGTKVIGNYVKLRKVYIANILLGERRDTGDMEGKVIEKENVLLKDIHEDTIRRVLKKIIGKHKLEVPVYSAVKVSGKPLYKYAREGKEAPEIPIKDMTIYDAELIQIYHNHSGPVIQIRMAVSSGSYVRAIAEMIGEKLGYPATLYELVRTQIGDFTVEDVKDI